MTLRSEFSVHATKIVRAQLLRFGNSFDNLRMTSIFIVYCAKFILLMKSVNIRLLSSIYCYSSNNFELTLAMHNQNIVSSSYHHRYNPDLVKLNYQIKSKYHCCNLYITTCCVIHMNTFALGFGQHFLLPIPLLTK